MQKTPVRTGVVGSGFSAWSHYEALMKVYGTNAEIIGVHSLDQQQGKAYT